MWRNILAWSIKQSFKRDNEAISTLSLNDLWTEVYGGGMCVSKCVERKGRCTINWFSTWGA